VYRYIREAVDVLAALAPTLAEAMDIARTKAFVILDGTLLPIDRLTEPLSSWGLRSETGSSGGVTWRSPSSLVW
jgi:hypothetical protein